MTKRVGEKIKIKIKKSFLFVSHGLFYPNNFFFFLFYLLIPLNLVWSCTYQLILYPVTYSKLALLCEVNTNTDEEIVTFSMSNFYSGYFVKIFIFRWVFFGWTTEYW